MKPNFFIRAVTLSLVMVMLSHEGLGMSNEFYSPGAPNPLSLVAHPSSASFGSQVLMPEPLLGFPHNPFLIVHAAFDWLQNIGRWILWQHAFWAVGMVAPGIGSPTSRVDICREKILRRSSRAHEKRHSRRLEGSRLSALACS